MKGCDQGRGRPIVNSARGTASRGRGGVLNVWLQGTKMEKVTISLSDLHGQVLVETKPSTGLSSINISDLSSGTYLIKVFTGNGVWVERIILR